MRKILLSVLTALVCAVGLKAQSLSHSTYMIQRDLKDAETVERIDYELFDYIYLMAAPAWSKADFTKGREAVLRELVTDFRYPSDGGRELVPYMIDRAHRAGTRVLLSFAGEGFLPKVSDEAQRGVFVGMMTAFVQKYGFDGIEVDWESEFDMKLHAQFLAEIRHALDRLERTVGRRMFLSTALHSWRVYTQELADKLSAAVDWINIMTYDMGGGIWGKIPSHNTPMDGIRRDLARWNVFAKDKLCIGLANYGFIYENVLPGETAVEGLKKQGRYISYNAALPLIEGGWTAEYDVDAQMNYYYNPERTGFITMDSQESLAVKVDWVRDEGFRGVFWWEYGYDLIPTEGKAKFRHHLIDPVARTLSASPAQ